MESVARLFRRTLPDMPPSSRASSEVDLDAAIFSPEPLAPWVDETEGSWDLGLHRRSYLSEEKLLGLEEAGAGGITHGY